MITVNVHLNSGPEAKVVEYSTFCTVEIDGVAIFAPSPMHARGIAVAINAARNAYAAESQEITHVTDA